MRKLLFIFLLSLISCNSKPTKPRVLILSDINNIGGDPDDKQSMAHLFMYANEVDIVGIIPDLWEGKGVEATMQTIAAYEQDYENPDYNFKELKYPEPDYLRDQIAKNKTEAIQKIITEAKAENEGPLHILIWGNMNSMRDALNTAPEIAENIRIYTIATHRMAANEDAQQHSKDTTDFGIRRNWNHPGRDEIHYDPQFKNLWWLENDWAYNAMFEGAEPKEFLNEIKENGTLGNYIWEVVQPHDWARYFRAGDTPTLLYFLEPGVDINDPTSSSWAGKYIKPFPEERPNYWIDDAGIEDWNYANPENTWNNFNQVYQNRLEGLMLKRAEWYEDYRQKMKELYSK